jgi:hypothetical protein
VDTAAIVEFKIQSNYRKIVSISNNLGAIEQLESVESQCYRPICTHSGDRQSGPVDIKRISLFENVLCSAIRAEIDWVEKLLWKIDNLDLLSAF